MVDVKRIKVGDQILLRSRDVKTVTKVNHRDDDTFPVSVFWGTSCGMVAYTRDGFYWDDREEDYRDILEIIPAETSEETPIDATRIKVGDKVRLRNGEVKTVSHVTKNSGVYPAYPVGLAFEDDEARHGDIAYTSAGRYWRDCFGEDPKDILEIIPAETSEKTTDDIVTILSFSESEDNIISSLAGLQLTDRQIQGLNAILTAFTDEAKRAWGWNLDVYIRNAPRTINRKQLEDERENYAWPPNPLTGDVIGLMSLTADEDDE